MVGSHEKESDKKYSYADYCKWSDESRHEIIDGIVYDMNAPLRIHQKILQNLFRKFADYFDTRPCEVYLAPFDVRLAKKSKKDKDIFNVVQPDISIICDEEKLDEHGCIGAPDLIVEILSPSTASKDHIIKRSLYENFEVKEYWLIDPVNRIATVYKLNNKNKYNSTEVFCDTDIIEVGLFPDLAIDLTEVFPVIEKVVCENPPREYRI